VGNTSEPRFSSPERNNDDMLYFSGTLQSRSKVKNKWHGEYLAKVSSAYCGGVGTHIKLCIIEERHNFAREKKRYLSYRLNVRKSFNFAESCSRSVLTHSQYYVIHTVCAIVPNVIDNTNNIICPPRSTCTLPNCQIAYHYRGPCAYCSSICGQSTITRPPVHAHILTSIFNGWLLLRWL